MDRFASGAHGLERFRRARLKRSVEIDAGVRNGLKVGFDVTSAVRQRTHDHAFFDSLKNEIHQ